MTLKIAALVILLALTLEQGGRIPPFLRRPQAQGGQSGLTEGVLFDDFEGAAIRAPNGTDPIFTNNTNWGGPCEGASQGSTTLSTSSPQHGSKSLSIAMNSIDSSSGCDFYRISMIAYPDLTTVANWKLFVQPPEDWETNTFNRLRFWIKIPAGFYADPTEAVGETCNLGMYVRPSSCDGTADQECGSEGGYHLYTLFWIPYTGIWQQVIFDDHPSATRLNTTLWPTGNDWDANEDLWSASPGEGSEGWTRHPIQAEQTQNLFDRFSTWYFACGYSPDTQTGLPVEFLMDNIETYEEPQDTPSNRVANIGQVFALTGAHRGSDDRLVLGWNHRRELGTSHEFDIKYAFSDIYTLGWASATSLASGITPCPGTNNPVCGYTAIVDAGANPFLYVAIRPTSGATNFNQIILPASQ